MAIGYTTLERATSVIANRFGLTVEDNREELVNKLNTIRSLMYSSYAQYDIAVDRRICLQVQDYCLDCDNCKNTYKGITLPYDAASAESIKIYGANINRRDGKQNVHDCEPCIEAWEIVGRVPTQKEIGCDSCGLLKLLSDNTSDNGLKSVVVFLDSQGDERSEELIFGEKPVTTMAASKVLSVSLPSGRKGNVNLFYQQSQSNDCLLSTYRRSEYSPNYSRIRINTSCPIEVEVVYARKFLELFDDSDLVETDSVYALQEFASYLNINERANNTSSDRAEAETHLGNAQAAILGTRKREEGTSKKQVMDIRGSLSRHSGLATRGNRYSWRRW